MKFKLGQKVKYKRISKKINIIHFWTPKDFEEDEEKRLERREIIELNKERVGYIAGRRRLVFTSILGVEGDYEEESYLVDIIRQEKGFVYLVAYDMGHTDYVLEEDLKIDK
jgi:hypothetical protein